MVPLLDLTRTHFDHEGTDNKQTFLKSDGTKLTQGATGARARVCVLVWEGREMQWGEGGSSPPTDGCTLQ